MRIEPYLLDDRVIIPDSINNMSKEQIEREIARIEDEIRTKKVIDITDGQMDMIKACRRSPLAKFSGHVKILAIMLIHRKLQRYVLKRFRLGKTMMLQS